MWFLDKIKTGNTTRILHGTKFHVGSGSLWICVAGMDCGTYELKDRSIYIILWLGRPYETLRWSKDIFLIGSGVTGVLMA